MISLANQMAPMTMDDVRTKCPYAFAEAPTNPGVSEKYTYANTETVINDMAKLGWYPVEAKQCRQKKGSSGIRSFHIVALQNDEMKLPGPDGKTESYVRIIIQNSHDGFNSFKFMCGLYRCICSNGLVLADAEFASLSIRHINYSFDELRNVVSSIIDKVPIVISTMERMKSVVLTDEDKRNLATKVLKIRKGVKESEKFNVDEETISDILTPLRKEDESDDLWTVFNVCQEKMIKGGFSASGKNNKHRKQRTITSIKKDIDYNQKLWEYSMNFLQIAA